MFVYNMCIHIYMYTYVSRSGRVGMYTYMYASIDVQVYECIYLQTSTYKAVHVVIQTCLWNGCLCFESECLPVHCKFIATYSCSRVLVRTIDLCFIVYYIRRLNLAYMFI